jgi:hypothetical protein
MQRKRKNNDTDAWRSVSYDVRDINKIFVTGFLTRNLFRPIIKTITNKRKKNPNSVSKISAFVMNIFTFWFLFFVLGVNMLLLLIDIVSHETDQTE